jgi:hypothetical protein
MAAEKKTPRGPSSPDDVDEFLRRLDHPLKPALEAVRSIIRGVSPEIQEGIKWNAPSFKTTEYFATVNIRKDVVFIILHLGAKVKDNSRGLKIDDPTGLLEWLATDRAVVTFRDLDSIESGRKAFESIIRQWIGYI